MSNLIASISLFACAMATAGEAIDMQITTPAIQKLKAASATRAAKLDEWKDFGFIGEARDGMLAVRSLAGVKLSEKKQVEDLIAAENDDRKALYGEIAKANGLKEDDAARVLPLAAKAYRAAARPGHWVQRPFDGAWANARDVKE